MIKQIRQSKFTKIFSFYLGLTILFQMFGTASVFAGTSGPSQPEFNSFTPISTSEMINLSTGNFNYNIPLMDVGGYPINLSYDSGITMEQEASWVGLGWNLNVGQISRQVRGLPDDFKDDKIEYQNNLKKNITVGTNFNLSPAVFGKDFPFNLGLGVQYNNFSGISFKPSIGVSYSMDEIGQVGVNLTGSVEEGASLTPSLGISKNIDETSYHSLSLQAGLSTRKGFENLNVSVSKDLYKRNEKSEASKSDTGNATPWSLGGYLSFNNQSYTPSKRVAFDNFNGSFNASVGGEVFGLENQVRITAYGSIQEINKDYKLRNVGGYGYDYTHHKNDLEGVLDFNREKEQTVNKNTNVLPVSNYTYDIYDVQSQGLSGAFRPHRSQVAYIYNDEVSDFGASGSFGAELGLGNLVHGGVNFLVSPTISKTGPWKNGNHTLPAFTERHTDNNNILYESAPFKFVGELAVESDNGYIQRLNGTKAQRLKINGNRYNRYLSSRYVVKQTGINSYFENPVNARIKRSLRLNRTQTVQKIKNAEADDLFVFKNSHAKPHHTAGIKILAADGTSQIFGKSVYNTKKVEATFDVSGKPANLSAGTVNYLGSLEGNGDKYLNKITTPSFAHSYLITSVLSADYEDIDDNGPSDQDLGNFTKFKYITLNHDYQWRTPFTQNTASYNEGLKSKNGDEKGTYLYGAKELTYLSSIETKTHVAFLDLEDRLDALGVVREHGGTNSSATKQKMITSIRLYSKGELTYDANGQLQDPRNNNTIKPIKTVHFEYDYELCPGMPNTNGGGQTGKLTLKKLYFTFRNSNMGHHTPYKFNYGFNPNYNDQQQDIWGNYKVAENFLRNTDFPFVKQDKNTADLYSGAWTLREIKLPSGGNITIETESDDYRYVQDRKAMRMFKVLGAGNSPNASDQSEHLYTTSGGHRKFIYVKVNDTSLNSDEFIKKYLSENLEKPIYFKFLLNMTASRSDFVSGYFEIDKTKLSEINVNSSGIASIPVKFLRKEGGLTAGDRVNPFSKAGWGFGRTYLNREVYSLGGNSSNEDFVSIATDLVGSIGAMTEIFRGPNAVLETKGCARTLNTNQSWIRLENPAGFKFGGGVRVKKILLSDRWDLMNEMSGDPRFEETYGQEYSYRLEDGVTSSGVATFEPNASPENPFVEPFYGVDGNYEDRITAPKENNYVEKPFGESFFPSPAVTYSRVTVKNLDKTGQNEDKILRKHATGKVVTEFYTSKDFPTRVDYTNIDIKPDFTTNPLKQLLRVHSQNHLTASQGFSIETNDMNGKMKSEKIFAENQTSPISMVEYKYKMNSDGSLNNNVATIDEIGETKNKEIGVVYDMVNDFNESRSETVSAGGDANLAAFLAGIWPAIKPTILPRFAYHETILRTATTTKVIHRSGILEEKVAHDLGSRVSTKNIAWDAKTGNVLLNQTINEFNDNYYNFNYPAYWKYKGMGLASENLGLRGRFVVSASPEGNLFTIENTPITANNPLSKFLKIGDEIQVKQGSSVFTFWVSSYNEPANNKVLLINRNGSVINHYGASSILPFVVTRSGNVNMPAATMASVTSMINPIDKNGDGILENIDESTFLYNGTGVNPKIVNASAVEYNDLWKSQCENNLPDQNGLVNGVGEPVNPFVYNLKNEWRASRSFAYLTGRNNFLTGNRRNTGFYQKFSPMYVLVNNNWDTVNTDWTFASEVTKFSPYGVELENRDALDRYSSAQYGYNYKLPVAVASNTKYEEIGYDGFEDYSPGYSSRKPHFGFSQSIINGAYISSDRAHSGKSSLAIPPQKNVKFVRRLTSCN